jgi:hypothetical protein
MLRCVNILMGMPVEDGDADRKVYTGDFKLY